MNLTKTQIFSGIKQHIFLNIHLAKLRDSLFPWMFQINVCLIA